MRTDEPTSADKTHDSFRPDSNSAGSRFSSLFGRFFHSSSSHLASPIGGDQAADHERVIANVRFVFAGVLLLATYLDPPEARNYVELTYGVLWAYALYSLGLIVAVRLDVSFRRTRVLLIHAVDVAAAAFLTALANGATSRLFVSFAFVLLAAGYRWGLRETVWTGVVSAVLFNGRAILSMISSAPAGKVEGDLTVESFVIRIGYLMLFTVMIGYLAERQRASRAEQAATAAAAERAHLARELHDGVIQSLLGIKMRVEVLRRDGSLDSSAISELQHNETLLGREVVNLRMLMFELASSDEEPIELSPLLGDLAERFQHASGIETRFVTAGVRHVSDRARHEIVRIVQESLVNIHKHSGARNALVRLSEKGDRLELTIEDDGRGFDFEGRKTQDELDRMGKGPRIIRQRVRLLGGSLTIESTPGAGALLAITLPLQL
jgi:signal transduction histidine kinase